MGSFLERDCRQGDRLLPSVFILCSELLNVAVCHNDTIQGKPIGDSQCKLVQYANDTTSLIKQNEVFFFCLIRSLNNFFLIVLTFM